MSDTPTTQESIVATLAGMSVVQAADWMRLNAGTILSLPAGEAKQIEAFIDGKAKGDDRWTLVREAWDQASPASSAGSARVAQKKLEQKAADQIATTGKVNADLDLDGSITPEEKKAADTEAKKAGDATGFVITASADPDWLVQANNGQQLTQTQKNRIVDEWNEFHPTTPVHTWSDLLPRLSGMPDERTKMIASYAAAGGDQPLAVSYQITLPGNRQVVLSADQMARAEETFGLGADMLTKVTKYADMFGLKTATGDTAWQPLAALMKASGLSDAVDFQSGVDQKRAKVKSYEEQLAKLKEREPLTRPDGSKYRPTEWDQEIRSIESSISSLKEQIYSATGAKSPFPGTGEKINELTLRYNQGLKKYGNDAQFAYLHALDSDLASRIVTAPDKLTSTDMGKLQQYFLDGGFDPETLRSLGYATSGDLVSASVGQGFLSQLLDEARAAGGGGAKRTRPDPESVKQGVRDLWRAMFKAEPSDALVQQWASELDATIAGTPDDQDIDVSARMRAFAEASPEYKKFYGNKPGGMTEMDYQSQFTAGVSDIIGAQADDEAVKLGMQSGDYNTGVGASFMNGSNWGNSRLMQRLSIAASTVNAST